MTPRDIYEENQRKLGDELMGLISEHGLVNLLWALGCKCGEIADSSPDKEYSMRMALIALRIYQVRDIYGSEDSINKPPLTEEETKSRIEFQNNVRKKMCGKATPEIEKAIQDYAESQRNKANAAPMMADEKAPVVVERYVTSSDGKMSVEGPI